MAFLLRFDLLVGDGIITSKITVKILFLIKCAKVALFHFYELSIKFMTSVSNKNDNLIKLAMIV